MTSEQGNPPEKGEGSDDQSAAERVPETDTAAEAGSTASPEPEPANPDDSAGAQTETPAADEDAAAPSTDADVPAAPVADAAPEPEAPAEPEAAAPEAPAAPEPPQAPEAPEAPSIDEGATESMPTSALADSDVPPAPAADVPASPVADAAPEPEAPQAAPEAPAEPAAPSVDEGDTQAIPTGVVVDIDIPAAPSADSAPEQVAPAAPEPPAAQAPPSTSQFDEDGTQILRLQPSQPSSPPAPAADPYDDRTEVLPPQGHSGFNAPAPYGEQPAASSSAWPSPPPNPLANQGAQSPAPAPTPSPVQSPGAVPPPPPAAPYVQPAPTYQAPPPPPAAQQPPPTQSDATQKLIIGAHNPYSEPPPAMAQGYDPNQAAQSQPGGQYSQPGMPPGSVPPGQYPPQGAQGKGGKKKLVPILAAVVALVVIAAGVGLYFLLFAAPKFEENGCVRHTSGDQAEAIDCDEAKDGEDYEIVQKVGDGQECADAGRETLTVGEDTYCLSLLGAPEEGEGGAEPTDEAS